MLRGTSKAIVVRLENLKDVEAEMAAPATLGAKLASYPTVENSRCVPVEGAPVGDVALGGCCQLPDGSGACGPGMVEEANAS